MGNVFNPIMIGAFVVDGLSLGEGGGRERCCLGLGGPLGLLG